MLSGGQGVLHHFPVVLVRTGDDHRVQSRVGDHVLVVGVDVSGSQSPAYFLCPGLVDVADGIQAGGGDLVPLLIEQELGISHFLDARSVGLAHTKADNTDI